MQTLDDRREMTAGLLDSLGRLIRTSKALRHQQTTQFGLTGTPFGILKTLAQGDARPGDVAGQLQIAPSVVSRAVVPLEQEQLVERRTETADARAWRLGLTEAGHRKLAELRAESVDTLAPLLADWDSNDLAALTDLMRRLERTLCRQLDHVVPHATTPPTNEGHA
ncbi:MarR family winged helix-turn-helix transcriptional regulator [uncultured Friedmanniella sp.]|uniref:MarR family winged helix-turn-helix transcriptional regulator n=1 Tax=uncultured Friedmanniella sp. TaxID=335381 RepID=UPI0035C9FD59